MTISSSRTEAGSGICPSRKPPRTQAQEAVADEACRVVEVFRQTGRPANCVNLTRSACTHALVVRHLRTAQAVVDRLQNQAPEHIRVTNQALQHALAEAGWTDLGLCASRTNPGKRHIWASPEFRGSKSEARDATETHIAAMPSTRPYRVS